MTENSNTLIVNINKEIILDILSLYGINAVKEMRSVWEELIKSENKDNYQVNYTEQDIDGNSTSRILSAVEFDELEKNTKTLSQ